MTKSEFVDRVADRSGLGKGEADKAVGAVLDTIEEVLTRGGEISFTGFGKFSVADRSAREGVNPQTGEKIQIAASKVPRFSAGSALKKAVKSLLARPHGSRTLPTGGTRPHFCDRLAALVEERRSRVVLGLDPDPAALWPEALERFADTGDAGHLARAHAAEAVADHCRAAIVAAGPACVAVKLQLACFERLGAPGWEALESTVAVARDHGLLVLADGKRGDVPVTARAYAQALVGETPDALRPGGRAGRRRLHRQPAARARLARAAGGRGRGGRRGLLRARAHLQPGRRRAPGRGRSAAARAARARSSSRLGAAHAGRVRALARGRGHRRHPAGAAGAPARADAARGLPAARRGRAGRSRGGPGAGLRAASRRRA